jgi:iron complex outermembrane receptor protein
MFPAPTRVRRLWLTAAASLSFIPTAVAQSSNTLPTITIEAEQPAAGPSGSLTVPTPEQARTDIQRTPGGVAIVRAEDYRTTTPAVTIKDILDYVPGVFVQPKWGEDSRLSTRGSSLSRNFHLRGVQLFMDGVPVNTADGYGDFQEIDPTAYRYVEVYKGANALRYGAASLGGAINFVTPSGRDAPLAAFSVDLGSFGFARTQAQSAGRNGAWDGFITASAQRADGFRDHSEGHAFRGSGNVGYQITPDIETRFYLNANSIRQNIPGSVTKSSALNTPQTASANNLLLDQQRNIDSVRFANKTTARFGSTTVEVGAFGVDRHLMHPIFQWLDYQYDDYGVFGRVTDDRRVGDLRNRFIAGVNVHNGRIDNRQFANLPGAQKGALMSSSIDRAKNTSVYVEDQLFVLPNVAVIGGTQFVHATRSRQDRFLSNGDQSGATDFNLWSPRAGLLWDIDPTWQAFANISRSAEIPSFGESSSFPAPVIPFTAIRPQRATTYEIGTRGRRPDLFWELTGYRANIKDEFLCLYSAFGNCNVTNADRTVHQGLEAALGIALFRNILSAAEADRLWLQFAYTFNNFRFDGDRSFGDNQLPGAPRHFLRAELLYKHPSGFFFGPNVEWVPQSYFVDSANTLKTEPYLLLGLKAGYDNGQRFSAYIEGRNLGNRKYIASASIIDRANPALPLFEPGTGLGVFGGVRFRIN